MTSPIALSGTPGVGKSSVARALAPTLRSIEVSDLALQYAAGRRIPGGVEVDLDRLSVLVGRRSVRSRFDLLVGHLAHLLPLRDVVVLRCHPVELARRLARSRPVHPSELHENLLVESTDLILVEALARRRRVWEVDTTGRSPGSVANEVRRRLRRRGPSEYGGVNWLADPWVTEHLLDWSR